MKPLPTPSSVRMDPSPYNDPLVRPSTPKWMAKMVLVRGTIKATANDLPDVMDRIYKQLADDKWRVAVKSIDTRVSVPSRNVDLYLYRDGANRHDAVMAMKRISDSFSGYNLAQAELSQMLEYVADRSADDIKRHAKKAAKTVLNSDAGISGGVIFGGLLAVYLISKR